MTSDWSWYDNKSDWLVDGLPNCSACGEPIRVYRMGVEAVIWRDVVWHVSCLLDYLVKSVESRADLDLVVS